MAQLVEQLIRNQQVVGSSPISSFLADTTVSAFFIVSKISRMSYTDDVGGKRSQTIFCLSYYTKM